MGGKSKGTQFSEPLFQAMEKYKSKTIKFRILHKTMVVTSDPNVIKAILIDKDCPKHPDVYKVGQYFVGQRFLGTGLVAQIDNEKWRSDRAIFNPGFFKTCLKEFMSEFNEKGNALVENLRKTVESCSNESIRMMDKFNLISLDVIASIAFGIELNSINKPDNLFTQYIHKALFGIFEYYLNPTMRLKRSVVNGNIEMIKYLRDFGKTHIESRIEAYKNGHELPNDILTILLRAHEGQEINIEEMIDQFITFLIGGQETTATTLATMFLELGRNADAMKKLRNEVEQVLGNKNQIEYDDLCKLKYTEAAFKETLRLYPPVGFINRLNKEDLNINGVLIPKDSCIAINFYCCGRNEDSFPDRFVFNPDRFLKNENLYTYSFLPFSLGSRNCIGQNFAKIEAKVLLAKIIQNFDYELDPNQSFEMIELTTARPKDGAKCFLKLK